MNKHLNNWSQGINISGSQISGNVGSVVNNQVVGDKIYNYNSNEKRAIAKNLAEIQGIIEDISQEYPTRTTSDKMFVAAKVLDQIENIPDSRERTIKALRKGGLEYLQAHPVGKIVFDVIKDW